jgi:hypothetical protein
MTKIEVQGVNGLMDHEHDKDRSASVNGHMDHEHDKDRSARRYWSHGP